MELFDCGMRVMVAVVTLKKACQKPQDDSEITGPIGSTMKKAKAGDGYFQSVLAEHYRDGDGVDRDLQQAKFWAECARTNREADATKMLEQINKKLAGVR